MLEQSIFVTTIFPVLWKQKRLPFWINRMSPKIMTAEMQAQKYFRSIMWLVGWIFTKVMHQLFYISLFLFKYKRNASKAPMLPKMWQIFKSFVNHFIKHKQPLISEDWPFLKKSSQDKQFRFVKVKIFVNFVEVSEFSPQKR